MKRLLKMLERGHYLADKDKDPSDGGGSGSDTAKIAELAAGLADLKNIISQMQGGGKPAPKAKPSDVDKVRKEAQEKAEKEAARARMESAIRFNLSSAKFIEDNKNFLGELAPKLYKSINEKPFSDEEKKEAAVKKGLMEYFFGLQENIDAAPEELKSRIMSFKALADDEKEKQASSFWEALTLTVDRKKLSAQIAAAKRANSGKAPFEEENESRKKYNDRVFALKSHYLGKGENK